MLPEPLQSIARMIYDIGGGQLCVAMLFAPLALPFLFSMLNKGDGPSFLWKLIIFAPVVMALAVMWFVADYIGGHNPEVSIGSAIVCIGVGLVIYFGAIRYPKTSAGKTNRHPIWVGFVTYIPPGFAARAADADFSTYEA